MAHTPPADACSPEQTAFAAGGCLRPPRLGAPVPPPPRDLRSLRYPAFVLGDVPLSLVSGYVLGGQPEPLSHHLESLAQVAALRAAPLAPRPAGQVRYLFQHYGQWASMSEVGGMVEAQLQRYEAGVERAPCLDLGLLCVPRVARSEGALRAALGASVVLTPLAHDARRILVGAYTWPHGQHVLHHAALVVVRTALRRVAARAPARGPRYGRADAGDRREGGALVVKMRDAAPPLALTLPLAHVPE